MKKAKIMLTAIAVLAVIGGAFAFKANRFGAHVYEIAPNGRCTITLQSYTTQPLQNVVTLTGNYASVTGPCTTEFVYRLL